MRDVPTFAIDVERLPARSVALSLLLGSHPARLGPAQLTALGEHFGVTAPTMRVALTRAVAAGDLTRIDGDYALTDRLAARQRQQDEGVEDAEVVWDGAWEMAIVVVAGRSGPERAALRDQLAAHRLAELREGVWTRPANLRRAPAYAADPVVATFRSRPEDDAAALAARLWDLDGWAAEACGLLDLLHHATEPADRLAITARIVRHLTHDPLLPADLRPADWPGQRLRTAYAAFQRELLELVTG